MIRFLLFLRAWHAELRLWKHGLKHLLKQPGALESEQLQRMHKVVHRYWVDFSQGYIDLRW